MTRAKTLSPLLSVVMIGLAAFAAAQPPVPAPLQETAADRRKAYAEEAQSLATILGSAHYLRLLCAGRGDQTWRNFMRSLLDQENAVRRSAMIDAFNEGYRVAEERFPSCGSSAQAEETELKAQGLRLADTLAARNRD